MFEQQALKMTNDQIPMTGQIPHGTAGPNDEARMMKQ
jgi:hypothetical protein